MAPGAGYCQPLGLQKLEITKKELLNLYLKMFPKNILKRVRREDFIVIQISSELSMNFDNNKIMVQTIEHYNPSFWKLLNPNGYFIYFLKNSENSGLAQSLYNTVTKLILNDELFSNFKIGMSEGSLISRFNLKGLPESEPLGIAANIPIEKLKGKIELQT